MKHLQTCALLVFLLCACSAPATPLPSPTASEEPATEVSPTQTPAATAQPQTEPISTVTVPSQKHAMESIESLGFRVVMSYPHAIDAFTEGLVFVDGRLFESTGLKERSSLREVSLSNGNVLRKHDVAREYFGEGLALVGDELVQLTWQEGVAFRYDRDSFAERGRWKYTGEGWGLAFDGASLVMSDGSAQIRFRNPHTFDVQRTITVTVAGRPLTQLNELEYADGALWSNVWQTDAIARIDPQTGVVTGVLDLTTLWPADQRPPDADVLNGIAFDSASGEFLVTGKFWPHVYRLAISKISQ